MREQHLDDADQRGAHAVVVAALRPPLLVRDHVQRALDRALGVWKVIGLAHFEERRARVPALDAPSLQDQLDALGQRAGARLGQKHAATLAQIVLAGSLGCLEHRQRVDVLPRVEEQRDAHGAPIGRIGGRARITKRPRDLAVGALIEEDQLDPLGVGTSARLSQPHPSG
eukprot:scaffold268125_cov22-Tisochrysis_lutea.AAC.1